MHPTTKGVVLIFWALLAVGGLRLAFTDPAGWARITGLLLLMYGIGVGYIAYKDGTP